ncbi:hypothetical protein ACK8P5_26345 (plasmid) [Paenibacillus sp. EC2-1]|uniref:hypothetical protein n=1 Tax=Paenibacillus sp. EC2-1 TaxID=3388665 RepID=UPI003BEF0778
MYSVGDRIIHRAWSTPGEVTSVPEGATNLSNVTVKYDDGREVEAWIPSIMLDFEYMVFDWETGDDEESGELLDTDEW